MLAGPTTPNRYSWRFWRCSTSLVGCVPPRWRGVITRPSRIVRRCGAGLSPEDRPRRAMSIDPFLDKAHLVPPRMARRAGPAPRTRDLLVLDEADRLAEDGPADPVTIEQLGLEAKRLAASERAYPYLAERLLVGPVASDRHRSTVNEAGRRPGQEQVRAGDIGNLRPGVMIGCRHGSAVRGSVDDAGDYAVHRDVAAAHLICRHR